MSSSRQAIYDDEIEWDAFCRETGADTRWDAYSREAEHTKKLHEKYGYTHRELKLAVQHAKQRDALAVQQANEWNELKQLIELGKNTHELY